MKIQFFIVNLNITMTLDSVKYRTKKVKFNTLWNYYDEVVIYSQRSIYFI